MLRSPLLLPRNPTAYGANFTRVWVLLTVNSEPISVLSMKVVHWF